MWVGTAFCSAFGQRAAHWAGLRAGAPGHGCDPSTKRAWRSSLGAPGSDQRVLRPMPLLHLIQSQLGHPLPWEMARPGGAQAGSQLPGPAVLPLCLMPPSSVTRIQIHWAAGVQGGSNLA